MNEAEPPHPPRPSVLASLGESADGVLSAWVFRPSEAPTPLRLGDIDEVWERREGVLWVHLNSAAAPAKQWLSRCRHLPEPIRDALLDPDPRTRLEPLGDGILGVIGDTVAGADPDPWSLSSLHFYVDGHWLISTRRRPVSCASKLGREVRNGLVVQSSAELMVWLLTHAADSVSARALELARDTDRTEDEVLAGRATLSRERLGKARRRAARLRRQVALRPRAIDRLRSRLPSWVDENDRFELVNALDRMETLVDELQAIEQREAGLEAEVAARLSEETNRNLFILSVVTVIFLPMTLITGIFGMNVAGLPGLADPSAFWWVMLAMSVVPAVFLAALRWRRRS
jgi:zinc transporter